MGNPRTFNADNYFRVNAEMYMLGDRYDLPALKKLAVEKFEAVGHYAWPPHYFMNIVYSTTPQSDRELGDIAAQACKKGLKDILTCKLFKGVMDKHLDVRDDLMEMGALRFKEDEEEVQRLNERMQTIDLLIDQCKIAVNGVEPQLYDQIGAVRGVRE